MKTNVFAGLLVAATLCIFAPNANAQDAAQNGAPAAVGQTRVCDECQECEGGFVGGGFRSRVAGLRGGAGLRGAAAGLRATGSTRVSDFREKARVRDIVAPSPYATPNGEVQDWARFRYYPYGFYPHNFADSASNSMQVQQYNPAWQNFYPTPRRFHEGKHFILDVF